MVTSDIIQNGAVLNFIPMMSLISVIHSLSTSATSHGIHGYFREKFSIIRITNCRLERQRQ